MIRMQAHGGATPRCSPTARLRDPKPKTLNPKPLLHSITFSYMPRSFWPYFAHLLLPLLCWFSYVVRSNEGLGSTP